MSQALHLARILDSLRDINDVATKRAVNIYGGNASSTLAAAKNVASLFLDAPHSAHRHNAGCNRAVVGRHCGMVASNPTGVGLPPPNG